jgi:hypothetical protein
MENHKYEGNQIVISEAKDMFIADYDLSENNRIEFLFDYSKILSKKNLYDKDILYWQIENSALLKPMGVDMEFIKDVYFLILEGKRK